MFFKKQDKEEENDSTVINPEVIDLPLLAQSRESDSIYDGEIPTDLDNNSSEIKRNAFYAALQGKSLEDLILDRKNMCQQNIENEALNTAVQIDNLKEQIDLITQKIEDKKKRLEHVPEIRTQFLEDRTELKQELYALESKFRNLIENLGDAHKNLIQSRLKEVEEELEAMVNIYNSVFEKKLANETDLKEAVVKQRALCEELISKTRNEYNSANEKLASEFRLGSTKLTAYFLVSIGFLAAIGAGWFFAILSDFNELESQNWLFFSLNNVFNYLSIYVSQYGQFYATSWMILSMSLILTLLTIVIFISQSILTKMTHDKLDSQFGLDLTTKTTKLFRFKIGSNSFLSFWLLLLPWLFMLGVFFIVLAVGQSVGLPSDQIGKLGQHLSSQFIGIVIALLCAGICFIYIMKVIEPRKKELSLTSDSLIDEKRTTETKENRTQRKRKWQQRELVILVISVNTLLGIIIVGQSFEGLLNQKQALLSILCFVVLVNVAAFILSYGIRQIGLIRLSSESETRLIALSNYRKALSGNKPIQVWIKEERQFQRYFLLIQRELFDLIGMKNKSLNQLKRKDVSGWFGRSDEGNNKTEFKPLGSLNLTRKKEAQFYMLNFPHLTYQIEKIGNLIKDKKREQEEIDIKIREMVNRNSGFHIRLNNELGQQNAMYQKLQLRISEIDSKRISTINRLREDQDQDISKIREGYQLGIWTKENLMRG